jgi:NAD-dependent deacetylase
VSKGTLEEVAEWINTLDRVMVLTGAGISTESDIPDFRGPNGIWTKDPNAEKVSNIQNYLSNSAVRRASWDIERNNPMLNAKPNAGHIALAELNAMGCCDFIVTQNIDGLHQKAGFPDDSIVEIHGNNRETICVDCRDVRPIEETIARKEADPHCLLCGGIVKRHVVYFGEQLNPDHLARADAWAEHCDVFLAIGTSLEVYPAAGLPEIARFHGARFAIFNAQRTSQYYRADAHFSDPLGKILPRLVQAVKEA